MRHLCHLRHLRWSHLWNCLRMRRLRNLRRHLGRQLRRHLRLKRWRGRLGPLSSAAHHRLARGRHALLHLRLRRLGLQLRLQSLELLLLLRHQPLPARQLRLPFGQLRLATIHRFLCLLFSFGQNPRKRNRGYRFTKLRGAVCCEARCGKGRRRRCHWLRRLKIHRLRRLRLHTARAKEPALPRARLLAHLAGREKVIPQARPAAAGHVTHLAVAHAGSLARLILQHDVLWLLLCGEANAGLVGKHLHHQALV
mmetsp:Transcript_96952/g.230579  ORF Transcript_96952/g.230579 Transcript_96952/m.230579 type:complete len:253 (+) Transcript_96952:330-1088(+)